MNHFENEFEKMRTQFKFRKNLIRSDNVLVYNFSSNSPSPPCFLENFSTMEKKGKSVVEEIFQEENERFYNRFLKTQTSSPNKTPARLETSYTESPAKSKRKKSSFLPPKSQNPRSPYLFPNIALKRTLLTRRKNQDKLENFMLKCSEAHKTISENSSKFNNLIEKERKIARNYSKDLQWTSKKLLELDGYKNKIIKALYEEHKVSHDSYETEKKTLSKRYNHRTLADYTRRIKHIKTLLVTYKNKVIP